MADEILSDDRFKSEMTRMMQTVILKIDGLENRFDGLETRFDGLETRCVGLENRFDRLENKVDVLSKQIDGNRLESRRN